MKFPFCAFIVVLISIAFSCKKLPDESILIRLKPSTFSDELVTDGEVMAVNSIGINGPANLNGTIVSLVEDGTFVKQGDTVCLIENKQIENYYETMLTNVENTRTQYTTTKANLELKYAMLKAQLENIEAQTAITNLDSVQLKYLSPMQQKIKELELKRAIIQKEKVQREFDYLKPINDSELRRISLQIKQDSIRSLRYKEMLDNMVITSPIDGMMLRGESPVQYGEKYKEGDMTYPGYPIASIPDMSKVKVKIMASEADYKRIAVNDSVIYTFDGMIGNFAWGKVTQIAPMGKPISRDSKIKEFEITASVDSFSVIPSPGLSANCRIILENIPDTVVVPQLAIFEEDSMKVVYALDGRRYNRREVLLGVSSPKEAVVIAGLEGNETLAFIKPSQSEVIKDILLTDSIRAMFVQPKPVSKISADKTESFNQLTQNRK